MTPPETLRLPAGRDWRVRVVPNLYPAFERQEVVVHTPRHARSLGELQGEELDLVAEAWRRRREDVPAGYLHALVNEGRDAGASLLHSHSQLVWLAEQPPAVTGEQNLDDLVRGERVVEDGGLVAVCPHAGRAPYEVVVAPAERETDAFASPLLGPALRLLADLVRRLRQLEGPVPLNAWLHTGAWWHLELLPRLTVFAGIELGAGIYVNPLPPERAAAALRDVG
jgi:UDPglucose--hexose-1-phosphate uridylyltransferase